MSKFMNTYDLELKNYEGETVNVSLRLTTRGCMALTKKYPGTKIRTILLEAIEDIDKFVDLINESLKFSGNENTVKDACELIDLMADNDKLGMIDTAKIVTALGRLAGLFSVEQKNAVDSEFEDAFGIQKAEKKNSKN